MTLVTFYGGECNGQIFTTHREVDHYEFLTYARRPVGHAADTRRITYRNTRRRQPSDGALVYFYEGTR